MNRRGIKKSRLLSFIITILLGCMFVALPVLAEGTGDGTGGGQNVALDLVSSSPADGQQDVPLNGDIKLTFNKNVIYLLIRDANKACITLTTAEGSQVPIEVIMADDQTPEGFAQRRDITVSPLAELEPGTAYVVTISPDLQAKNGMSLGHEDTVDFVTAGAVSQSVDNTAAVDTEKNQTPVDQSVPDAVVSSEPSSSTGEDNSTVEEKELLSQGNSSAAKTEEDNQSLGIIYGLTAGLILLAALGYVYLRKKNKG